jgi:kynurenine formamidase
MALHDSFSRLRVYDLGRRLEFNTPIAPTHIKYRMALLRRPRDVVRPDGSSSSNELLSLSGHTGTHIDALCHFERDGKLHGGVDAVEASRGGKGFTELGIDTVAPIVCRGVLLDAARALGEELGPGRALTAGDLQEVARRQGVEVRRGDAVLVRTGWAAARYGDESFVGFEGGAPGPDLSAARWLTSLGVRVTGSDTIAYEVVAAGQVPLPVHVHLLVDSGVHILEVLDLEELAADGVHEFGFVCAPLKLAGATGSPVRPLALVET